MTYEFIQAALTATINAVAIAGLTGIILHAFYTSHCRFLQTYCPSVASYTPDTQTEVTEAPVIEEPQPIEEDVWEGEVEPIHVVPFRPVSRHFSPQLALPPVKEELKPARKTRKTPASKKAPAKSRTTRRRKTA